MNAPLDPVRTRTAADVLRRIDEATLSSLVQHAEGGPDGIASRLQALDREWDVDRAVELEAALTGLAGLALGVFVRRPFLVAPAFVAASVLAFAAARRYPLLPALRRLGVRSAREIARERYALKALRGDFADLAPATLVARRAVPTQGDAVPRALEV